MENESTTSIWQFEGREIDTHHEFGVFADALEFLASRTGAFIVAKPDISAAECLDLVCLCTERDDLDVGVVPNEREPASFLSPGPSPGQPVTGSGQVIFDGLDCGFGPSTARLVSREDPGEECEQLLGAAAELAYFVGHSNGLHSDAVSRVLTACETSDPRAVERGLGCFTGGPCFFGDRRFAPDQLGAKRIVSMTCWGLRLDDLYDRELSVGEAITKLPQLEVYVAGVRVIRVNAIELMYFSFLINSGLAMAEVVRRVNRMRIADGQVPEYMCFGNPRSALPATLIEHRATQLDAHRYRLELDPSQRGEFVFVLPGRPRFESQHVALLDGGVPDAAVLRGDRLFVSVLEPLEAPMEIELVDLDEFIGADGTPAQLLRDGQAIAPFFARVMGLGAEARATVLDVDAQLRAMLQGWPLLTFDPGSIIEREDLVELDEELDAELGVLATALLDAYVEFALHSGPGGSVVSGSVWAWLARARELDTHACAYCPGSVVSTTLVGVGGMIERRVAYCDRCGLVSDGDGVSAKLIAAPESVEIGARLTVHVEVENPYERPYVAHVRAILQAPVTSKSVVSETLSVKLGARERARLRLDIDASLASRSVCPVSACVVIGTRFGFLRNHVRVVEAGD